MASYFNLEDDESFPPWSELPGLPEDGPHIFLAEIQQCDGFWRFRTIVKDLEGKECVVAFYPDSYEDTGFDFKKLKRGHTLAIINAYQHEFLDGTHRRQGRGHGRRQREFQFRIERIRST